MIRSASATASAPSATGLLRSYYDFLSLNWGEGRGQLTRRAALAAVRFATGA